MMDTFSKFNQKLSSNLSKILTGDYLFAVDVSGDELWETYLESFPPEHNRVFRERREHDCSCCRAFVREFGAVVAIIDNELVSIWKFDAESDRYQPSIDALNALVMSRPVRDVYVTKYPKHGTHHSNELQEDKSVRQWNHFYVELPARCVSSSRESEASIMGEYRASKDVFTRSLTEIDPSAVDTVLELIAESSLYKGAEWTNQLQALRGMQDEYLSLPEDRRDNYCWSKSMEVGSGLSRIRNHSIGVLLQDISAGKDVLESVKRYERIVAPSNYKRPKEIFTKRMVGQAQATVQELGLTESLPRKFARLTDVTVNNVLFADRDAVKAMSDGGVFEQLMSEARQSVKSFERAPAIGIDEFLSDVLPTATNLAVLLENKHSGRMVSLIAPVNVDAPTMFKWNNNFSWAYFGNVTDSLMKRNVALKGGDINAPLRFSIQWNDENVHNRSDYDAHCIEPDRNRIYYGAMKGKTGSLDVDITRPQSGIPAVENIAITRPTNGTYNFLVHNYAGRSGDTGFRAEIEFDGNIHEYNYPHRLQHKEDVKVADVTYKNGEFELHEHLESSTSTKQIWGLNSQQFHRVSLVTYSPNYWDEQRGIGHRHVFFMMAGAVNDETPNGFYNEYLRESFMEHKRVFAALGSKMKVAPDDEQLSGVGFSTTRSGAVIVRVDDSKVYKVIFN
jgi:hypothetical protein